MVKLITQGPGTVDCGWAVLAMALELEFLEQSYELVGRKPQSSNPYDGGDPWGLSPVEMLAVLAKEGVRAFCACVPETKNYPNDLHASVIYEIQSQLIGRDAIFRHFRTKLPMLAIISNGDEGHHWLYIKEGRVYDPAVVYSTITEDQITEAILILG